MRVQGRRRSVGNDSLGIPKYFNILTLRNCIADNNAELSDVTIIGNPTRLGNLESIPADDGYIVYDQGQDRVHYLNPVAALVLELCTGDNSAAEIAELVRDAYGLAQAPAAEVDEVLGKMKAEGLLA